MSGNPLLLAAAWIAGILLILAVALTVATADVVTGLQYLDQLTAVVTPLVLGFLAVAAVRYILSYLQVATPPLPPPPSSSAPTAGTVSGVSKLSARLTAVEDRLARGIHTLKESERENLITRLQQHQHLDHAAAKEFIDNIVDSINEDQLRAVLQEWHTRTIDRLLSELSALVRRGNLNLALGFGITFVGIAPLAFFVLFGDLTGITVENFLPRITLTLFIETFAYFFLRLYSNSLIEIKYFKNEITNIEHKFLAFSAAANLKDETTMKDVVSLFAQTDRNAIWQTASATDVMVSTALNRALNAVDRRTTGNASQGPKELGVKEVAHGYVE